VSYRHLLVLKNQSERVECTPPHDVIGTEVNSVLPRVANNKMSETVNLLVNLIEKSQVLLSKNPVNQSRAAHKKPIANAIWPWSPGFFSSMPSLNVLYGLRSGAVISAVNLIHGIGQLAGLQSVYVEGATGLYTTNYQGKALAALDALKLHDYVFLHIEACDEAGHEGDALLKIRSIEAIDQQVVKPILENLAHWTEPVTIAFLPDHPTPCNLRIHTRDAVPFMIYRPKIKGDEVIQYNETSVNKGRYGLIEGIEIMKLLLTNEN
jgi:2,3-bisphosphoglycerate-independent phosphoglycerate mutase